MTGELLVSNSKIRELGELIEHQKGFAFKSTEYMAIGHPIVRVTNFTDRSIDMSDCNYLHPSQVKNYKAFFLQFDDVVIATVGSWLTNPASVVGKVIRVSKEADGALLNQNAVRLRANSEEINQKFLFYRLKNLDFQDYIVCTAQGSANQASITLKDIFNFKFYLPPLPEQKAIARILSSLDDKIELNQQMNRTLEAQARAIFKSWFVDFDPVRAKMEGRQPAGMDGATAALSPDAFEESELGMIPKGWEVSTIGESVHIYGGSTPSTKNSAYWEGGDIQWATPKDLSNLQNSVLLQTERRITELGLAQIGSGLLPKGTVLLSSRAPIGYLAISEIPVTINQGFIAMVCDKNLSNYYVLYWTLNNLDTIKGRANGTTFLEISKYNFRPISIIIPDKNILSQFNSKIEPLYKRIVSNIRESQNLATLRDFLLPKLMSGEIRVKDAEKMLEEVA
jgi:type I restriction enzyme S subunit